MLEKLKMNNLINAKEFVINAKEPGEWYRLSDWLKYSAIILEGQLDRLFELYLASLKKHGEESVHEEVVSTFTDWIGVESTYYLLMALAIENIIKGKLIEHNPEKIHFIAKIDPLTDKVLEPIKIQYPWGHNIYDLAKQLCKVSKLKISKNQENMLEHMSELIIWGGRYPAPTNIKVKSKDPFWKLSDWDRSKVHKLIKKLDNLKIKKTLTKQST